MQKPTLVLAALALVACATPAFAGGHSWKVGNNSYNVHLNDLDLKTAAGRAEALTRIEANAAQLCKGVGPQSAKQACVSKTVRSAASRPNGGAIRTALAEREAGPTVRLANAR